MAKRPPPANEAPKLFEHHERAQDRRTRRQRALLIPKFVREAASSQQLSGAAMDRAYAIATRWADLESSGNLAKHKETSIDTQFLDQLFGEGQASAGTPACSATSTRSFLTT